MNIPGYENKTFGETLIEAAEQVVGHLENKRKLRVDTVAIEPIPNYTPGMIKALRENIHLPQSLFGAVIGVSKKTVEAWEAGTRKPGGSAQRLFAEIDHNPNYLNKILQIHSTQP
ncbi:MAG: helix-turn-helix domain-containing protein [Clostridiales Family XIII bacterium]|jgi:putative transcriptional regulator|nr:helix-turn-helix domain-containing protein [Clostridiales Family XIII bacterium]